MPAIPPDLNRRLHEVLSRCGPLDSNTALYTSFTDTRTAAWRDRIPDNAYNRGERITALIDALHDQYNNQGENALVLFLRVVYEHTPVDDYCYQELTTLADELEQYAPIPDTPQWDAAVARYREWVKRTCGTMRVLGKHEPVLVEGIYTDVYMLEKPAASRYLDPQEGTTAARGKRQDGLKLVMQPGNERLVVLGQPGAGKTTFLKHIALRAAEGQLGGYVPILVYLREWVGGELLEFLTRPLVDGGITGSCAVMDSLLNNKRALLLLDGLDEVNESQRRILIQSIESFSCRYQKCRILLTCRVAATPHQFEGFSEVEVADFTNEQVLAFARNWFGEDTSKAEEFQRQIQQDERLLDLGRTPLLLGMLCLTFDEQRKFSQKRADLYRKGLEALLSEWDDSRSVKREAVRWAEIYHTLSTGRKHQLFAYIAHATFEKGEMLVQQERLERLIADYLITTPTAPARVDIDADAVTKAIEAQHGILVEYAQRVYTFAHPTFQEYYTAYYIAEQTGGGDTQALSSLLAHAHEDRWCEVILLTVSLLDEADDFFTHFLDALDAMVRGEVRLMDFLTWVTHKAISVNTPYRLAAMRVYYSALALDLTLVLDLILALVLDLILARAFDRALDLILARALDRDLARAHAFYHGRARALSRALALSRARGRALALALALDLDLDLARDRARDLDRDLAFDLALDRDLVLAFNRDRALDRDHDRDRALDLARALARAYDYTHTRACACDLTLDRARDLAKELNSIPLYRALTMLTLPAKDASEEDYRAFAAQLQAIMIEHRDIGHDWDFTEEQVKTLERYYAAANLLVECLDVAYVTDRAAIEDRLLLPPAP